MITTAPTPAPDISLAAIKSVLSVTLRLIGTKAQPEERQPHQIDGMAIFGESPFKPGVTYTFDGNRWNEVQS